MNEEKYISLYYLQLKGELDAAGKKELDAWSKDPANAQLIEDLDLIWQVEGEAPREKPLDMDGDFEALMEKRALSSKKSSKPTAKVRTLNSRRNFLMIAASLSLFIIGSYVARQFLSVEEATITITAENEIKQIDLHDGSTVWLNRNSSLSYSEPFAEDKRSIQLSGEAHFEVAKDAQRPFIVETTHLLTTVLGTSFNVKESAQETNVYLEEGSVKVENRIASKAVLLRPDESARFDHQSGKMTTRKDADGNVSAWKRKRLVFNDTPLKKALSDISTYYGSTIQLQNSTLNACPLSGRFRTDVELKNLLTNVADIYGCNLRQDSTIEFILEGGTCK